MWFIEGSKISHLLNLIVLGPRSTDNCLQACFVNFIRPEIQIGCNAKYYCIPKESLIHNDRDCKRYINVIYYYYLFHGPYVLSKDFGEYSKNYSYIT